MDPEVLKRLDTLAAKVGTTAEYLWPQLLKRAYADGMIEVTTALIVLMVGVLLGGKLWRFIWGKDADGGYRMKDSDGRVFATVGWIGFELVLACGFFVNLQNGLPDVLAPEVAALQSLFAVLK